MTGTPFRGSFKDLFSYLLFLKYAPFDTKAAFDHYLAGIMTSPDPTAGIQQVCEILKPIMLRRHARSRLDLRSIVDLPSR